MKTLRPALVVVKVAIAAAAWIALRLPLQAQAPAAGSPAANEYLTLRWAGRENTHVIRPGGRVEFVGSELRKLSRPDRCDERAFYMNCAMNGLVKEGWEFAGMTSDEIVMRRTIAH